MKRVTLYSKSTRSHEADGRDMRPPTEPEAAPEAVAASASPRAGLAARTRAFIARHERIALVASAALLSLLILVGYVSTRPPPREISQKDIDAAVLHTLDGNVLPSPAAKAFDVVLRIGRARAPPGARQGRRGRPHPRHRQRCRHRRQGCHPHQPARGQRRGAGAGGTSRRDGIRRDRHRHDRRTISPCFRRRPFPTIWFPRPCARRHISRGRPGVAVGFPSASVLRLRPAWFPASSANTAPRKASDC